MTGSTPPDAATVKPVAPTETVRLSGGFSAAVSSSDAAGAAGQRRNADVDVAERDLVHHRREQEDDDVGDDVHVGDEVDLARLFLDLLVVVSHPAHGGPDLASGH